jgi:hypothetical protein
MNKNPNTARNMASHASEDGIRTEDAAGGEKKTTIISRKARRRLGSSPLDQANVNNAIRQEWKGRGNVVFAGGEKLWPHGVGKTREHDGK